MIYSKADLIRALKDFNQKGEYIWRGEKTFTNFFADWLKSQAPDEKFFQHVGVLHYLPKLVLEGYDYLRLSQDEMANKYRRMFLLETEDRQLLSLTDINTGMIGGLVRFSAINTISRLLSKVIGEDWVEPKIEAYLKGQDMVLEQAFHRFICLVYRQGLFEINGKSTIAGMSGVFGKTHLRTFITAGRMMITFAREGKEDMDQYHVSFVADDSDPTDLRAGIQSVEAPLVLAVEMIEEVIKLWPTTPEGRAKVYRPDRQIRIFPS